VIKIRDRILLGVLAGIVCGTPGRIFNDLEYHLKLTDVKYGQMAANLFLPKNKLNSPKARIIASLINQTNISLMGVMVCYLLSATGRDKAVLKGIGVGATAWTTIYGLTARIGLSVKTRKPLSPILSFIDHALFGTMCGLFVSKFGHDSLFPDNRIKNTREKLPLINFNQQYPNNNDDGAKWISDRETDSA
jgi:hypothetical protein